MALAADSTTAIRPGEELNEEALASYLRERLPRAQGPMEVTQFPGGASNLTYLLKFGDFEMVLRRPPFGNRVKTAHDMGREYKVLNHLFPVWNKAPEPYLYCEDEAVIGAPFYVMERRTGYIMRRVPATGELLNPDTVRTACTTLIDTLAEFHALDYTAAGLGDLGKPKGYTMRQVVGWTKRFYNAQTHPSPEIDAIVRWLAGKVPEEKYFTLVHNDYRYDNVIYEQGNFGKIVGVLDWEMCTLGDPLTDIATMLAYWGDPDDPNESMERAHSQITALPGNLNRREIAEYYSNKTGFDMSNILFYYVFAILKNAGIGQQIYWRYFNGFTKDPRFEVIGRNIPILGRKALRAIESGHI